LFQEKVIQSFENAGYARSISRTREGVTGDYQLLVDIRRFHISTASEPVAEIDFVAKLLDKDGKIIAANTFQATAPAKGTEAKAYVDAIDEVFAKLMTELVASTTDVLDSVPRPPVTVAPPPAPDQPMP
jgi:phospholipid/cholesterol/gamma-HCH transport system substrate-binding protein